ncbi:MAG: polyphosphate kinase 1 [Cyclobacteriaceae bacterium]|nr:polyphosphate kinase 1 [Cyclobacteriaceae bacterium]MCH8517077.1 polyphosphate kinase 1 [Cyclobacteriaceae bacterium]
MNIGRIQAQIDKSDFISRDLSWLEFNRRVLDQAKKKHRNIIEKLKFMAITASNLDEFCSIRLGSLYNYLDYGKERIDYSGLRELPFRAKLLAEMHSFVKEQRRFYHKEIKPHFEENGFNILSPEDLTEVELTKVDDYFKKTVYPMLTPMTFDSHHTFPILMNQLLIFGVVTQSQMDKKDNRKVSFVQVPPNLPRFFEIERDDLLIFVPIEDVIRKNIDKLFRNVNIRAANLFRITRNGDFTLDESDDLETNFIDEIKRKLKSRKTGRVVRVEIEEDYNKWMMTLLQDRWEIDDDNVFKAQKGTNLDFTSFWQIVKHIDFKDRNAEPRPPLPPLSFPELGNANIFEVMKTRDILLHHPYNSMSLVVDLLELAAEDQNVLAIKLTIYRLAKDSRITNALLKAAENGKHVSVLFEVKARFDEENNIKEAKKLQQAGCFVIYGVISVKTHTKLLQIVRKEADRVTRYIHMGSGNYNEDTARIYTDIGLLTTNEIYAHDVSEFFNVITGHSLPQNYKYIITAPGDMRARLIEMIRKEAENAKAGLPAGIVIKINSLEDKEVIEELYAASSAGVRIRLIVRGICCLRPGRTGLSDNIEVISVVGTYLEHSRIYYFHNCGDSVVYGGSADIMVRSFDRRIESIFRIIDPLLKKEVINILAFNLKDNVNSYVMNENGSYQPKKITKGDKAFNIHEEFFNLKLEDLDTQPII